MKNQYKNMGLFLVILLGLLISKSYAQRIASRQDRQLYPGVTLATIRTASPATDVKALLISLCSSGVHIRATGSTDVYRTASTWGNAAGVQMVINGDFYASPAFVYGDAVGNSNRWPISRRGNDPSHMDSWFYNRYGWIAFGPDSVSFMHTKWVKRNLNPQHGWRNDAYGVDPPEGVISLVSGFPELVTEGVVRSCEDPTSNTCFPDRSDMQARHPRTAVGLTEDLQTLIWVVVDGRTDRSTGMYGKELAHLMGLLGAWQAFNYDGGGSSQMWQRGVGYLNNTVGNNHGNPTRAVLNHWGLFAGNTHNQGQRPGHCVNPALIPQEMPCQVIDPLGGTVDETGPCFSKYGPAQYWREENAGLGGHLYWTNAFSGNTPDNWAKWSLYFAQAGRYRLEAYFTRAYSVFTRTRYQIKGEGDMQEIVFNQANRNGWVSLGEFNFNQGGSQWVKVLDNQSGNVPSNQHINVDSIRLVRIDCMDEQCNGMDDDCDGVVPENEQDQDGDAFSVCMGDANDMDSTIYPGAPEPTMLQLDMAMNSEMIDMGNRNDFSLLDMQVNMLDMSIEDMQITGGNDGMDDGGINAQAGQEAGVMAGQEAGVMAGQETGVMAGQEAGVMAGQEAGVMAGQEAGQGAGQGGSEQNNQSHLNGGQAAGHQINISTDPQNTNQELSSFKKVGAESCQQNQGFGLLYLILMLWLVIRKKIMY